ncbi:MAG: nitroreductase family protein [Campylobacterales bacterium]|nr:nitroreductase family protein [Campylobacterales bacterium]
MDLQESILSRRSVRKYTSDKISKSDIETILKAGLSAPSAKNCQPWELIVIQEQKNLQKISQVSPHGAMLKNASFGIVICSDLDKAVNFEYGVIDTSACVENLHLSAHGLGIGSVWIGVYPRMERVEKLQEIFNLSKNIIPTHMMAFGYPAEEKKPANRYDQDKIHWEKW